MRWFLFAVNFFITPKDSAQSGRVSFHRGGFETSKEMQLGNVSNVIQPFRLDNFNIYVSILALYSDVTLDITGIMPHVMVLLYLMQFEVILSNSAAYTAHWITRTSYVYLSESRDPTRI